ncbi:MAG TPA: toll/interleukin-1 receptor domain-containing protein [Herpetosiphonaceae bacterium]
MAQQPASSYSYDVFISYSSRDSDWVHNTLLPRLEEAGLRVCIDFRDFEIGVPSIVNMENAVERSRRTLLVLTESWMKSEWTAFESLLTQTSDPAGVRRRTIPLLLERCDLPPRLKMLTYADFTNPNLQAAQLPRLINALKDPASSAPSASSSTSQAASSPTTSQSAPPKTDPDRAHAEELLRIKRRRLQVLERQEATLGLHVPPHIALEIEDLRREIADLESR